MVHTQAVCDDVISYMIVKHFHNRCIPLWVGARGIEFDWKYIQMSFDSNISLVSKVLCPKADSLV